MPDERSNFDAYLKSREEDIEHVIHELWATKNEDLWHREPYFYIKLGETADKLGQVMFAHDVLNEGLQFFSDNLRLTQLFALTSIKCGFLLKARELLSELVKRGHKDEETLGILGRVYKDLWLLAGIEHERRAYLERSRNLYLEAFRRNRGYYSGINAASMSLMLGEGERARKLATIALKICMSLLRDPAKRDYWGLATLGEGFLLLNRFEESRKYYAAARKRGGRNYSYLASTRKQLRLLSRYMDVPEEVLDILDIPPVMAFSGHMIDHPSRKTPRFPPELEPRVREAIRQALEQVNPGIGYSSAACGSDILFLECMQKRKAETNVVLPFDLEDFLEVSVRFAGEQWASRAEKVMARCYQRLHASEGKYLGDDLLFDYANCIIMGKALLRSSMLETKPLLLAVWDMRKAAPTGGTADFVQTWKRKGHPVHIIDLSRIDRGGIEVGERAEVPEAINGPPPGPLRRQRGVRQELKVMLFADLVGFGSLKEEQFPHFINGYLGKLASNLKGTRHKPSFRNLWGDALYLVFDDPVSAAEYALELRDFIDSTRWEQYQLPQDLNIRIGLHAGPVFRAKEPVLKKVNYFGRHVNRAARIEPITSPGNVYASEQFAALLMMQSNHALESRYVGIIVLPKQSGSYPIYHVKRKNEIN
jgi:class 3 adenylate cyclase/tetratricopeptide (TPR) repeat protein